MTDDEYVKTTVLNVTVFLSNGEYAVITHDDDGDWTCDNFRGRIFCESLEEVVWEIGQYANE